MFDKKIVLKIIVMMYVSIKSFVYKISLIVILNQITLGLNVLYPKKPMPM